MLSSEIPLWLLQFARSPLQLNRCVMVASLKSNGTASAIQMVSNRWCKHFTRSGLAYLKISGARPSAPSALPFFNALIAVFTSSSWIGAASASSVGYCGISSNTALSTIEVLFQICSKCSAQRCTITDGSVNRVFPLASFTAVVIEGPNVMSIGRLLQPPSPVTPPVSFHLSNFGLCSWLRLVVPVTLRRRFPRTVSAPFRVTACSTFHSASMSPEASFNSILRAWSSEEISWHSSERSSYSSISRRRAVMPWWMPYVLFVESATQSSHSQADGQTRWLYDG